MEMSLEYLAGFFDGEGSIGLYPNGRGSYGIRVQIVQGSNPVSREVFAHLKDRYGGGITHAKSSNGRPKMNWTLSSVKGVDFLKEIYPHLMFKKAQAKVLIDWWDTKTPVARGYRGRIVARTEPELAAAEAVHQLLKQMKKEN